MLRSFAAVLRVPGVAQPFLTALLGALLIGLLGPGVLLSTQLQTGSLATAGLTSGAFGIGNAVGLVGQSRWIDRVGPRRVLAPAAVVCAGALIALDQVPSARWPAAVLAGLSLPATITSLRALIPVLVGDPAVRRSGYALMQVLFGLATVLGAAVVAGLLAVLGRSGVLWTAAGLALVYGGRLWPGRVVSHVGAALGTAGLLDATVAGWDDHGLGLAVLLVLGGLVGAPAGVGTAVVLDRVAAPGALTQSYALLVSVGLLAGSAGNALGGPVVGWGGGRLAFAAAAVILLTVAGLTVRWRGRLERPARAISPPARPANREN